MEYRSLSTKLPSNELTMFKSFCEKKGVTPASLLRELVLREIKIPFPRVIAGKNKIKYEKYKDRFIWSIELDDGKIIDIIKDISPEFIEDLYRIIEIGIADRSSFIHKKQDNSVAVPSKILRRD